MNRSTIILVLAVLLAVAASFLVGGYVGRKSAEGALNRPDTVTITKWVRDSIPYPVDSIVYKTKLVYLPAVHDTTEVHDTTAVHDSVLVEVPIVEKTYEGENYKATVRGFNPELVDMWVKQTERTIFVPSRKRWSFTAGPQVGFGFTPNGWEPYAGAGVTFGYSF